MHSLSLGTWWIHIASVFEWILAIVLLDRKGLRFIALAMLPALISAMCACTWHFFDNSSELKILVFFQALFTLIGNISLAVAAYYQKKIEVTSNVS